MAQMAQATNRDLQTPQTPLSPTFEIAPVATAYGRTTAHLPTLRGAKLPHRDRCAPPPVRIGNACPRVISFDLAQYQGYAYMVPFCRCLWPGRDDAVLLLPDELGAGTLTVAPLDAAEEFRVQRSSPRRAEAESRFCPARLHFCRQVQHGCQL